VIVADASWLIALVDPDDAHHRLATSIRDVLDDEVVLLHPLTLAECLVGPARRGSLDQSDARIRAAVDVMDFDPRSPARFAQLRAEHRLRLPDAIVLDTALQNGVGIVTFDLRLAQAARRLGVRVLDTAADAAGGAGEAGATS
jgi:predicted nucleic acid-binding protein